MNGLHTPIRRPRREFSSPLFFHSKDNPTLASFVRKSHEIVHSVDKQGAENESLNLLQQINYTEPSQRDVEIRVYLKALTCVCRYADSTPLQEQGFMALSALCENSKWKQLLSKQSEFIIYLMEICYEKEKDCFFKLLADVSMGYKLRCSSSEIKDFILHLASQIQNAQSQPLGPIINYLRILSNLVQRNISVKMVLHDYENYSEFLSVLVSFIQTPEATVHALMLLVYLVLNTDRESEFFGENNLHGTLHIIFSLMSNSTITTDTLEKCTVLLTKLLDSIDIMSSLENFSQLEHSLCVLLELCLSNDEKIITLSLELMTALLKSQQIQKIICYMLNEKPQLANTFKRVLFSESFTLQITSRQFLRTILASKFSGLNEHVKTENTFASNLMVDDQFISKLIRCLCSQIRSVNQSLAHSFQVSKTSDMQRAQREIIELINILCHRKEFRRRFASSINIEDVETLLNRDNLCNHTDTTFPLVNLLFRLRSELPIINEKFLQLVEDCVVLKHCTQCLNSNSDVLQVKEALRFLKHFFLYAKSGQIAQESMFETVVQQIFETNKEITDDRESLQKKLENATRKSLKYQELCNTTYNELQERDRRIMNLKEEFRKDKEQEHQRMEKRLQEYKDQIQQLQETIKEMESKVSTQLTIYTDKIKHLESENKDIKKQAERYEKENRFKQNEVRELQLEKKDLQRRIDVSRERIEDSIIKRNEEKKRCQKFQNAMESLNQQNQHLNHQNKELNVKIQNKNTKLKEMKNLQNDYVKKLTLITRAYTKIEKEKKSLGSAKEAAEDANRSLQRKYTQSVSTSKNNEQKLIQLKEQNLKERETVKNSKYEIQKHVGEIDRLKKEMKELNEELEEVENDKERIQQVLTTMVALGQKNNSNGGRKRKRKKVT